MTGPDPKRGNLDDAGISADAADLYGDDFDGYDDEPEDGDDLLDMECGLGTDGQCSQAGTEHCDFVCPNRDSEVFAGSKAWNEKHECKGNCHKTIVAPDKCPSCDCPDLIVASDDQGVVGWKCVECGAEHEQ